MRIIRFSGLLVSLVATTPGAAAEPSSLHVGDTYEITKVRDSSTEDNGASSGSSHDQDTLIERIEAVRPDGLELVFDLPEGTTADERREAWQFPARVFKPTEGPIKLLNAAELESRVDAWLKWGKMTRDACGHWIFTWNAFKIECDPQSVLETIQEFDPTLPDLHDGAIYRDAYALRAAKLAMKSEGSDGRTFTASFAIDPNAVQRDRAQADVVVGEISRKPITLEAALAKRSKEAVSGTIDVQIDADAAGSIRRLTKITKSETKRADGTVETETITETLERRLISSREP
jgi:hypothetical protein